jgi:septum formation protein
MPHQRTIVLASASPRRKELLQKIGLEFIVDPSSGEEELTPGAKPEDLAIRIAEGKARAVAAKYPDALIIAADTLGVVRGRLIGKPRNAEEAAAMLRWLSGRSHRVISGLTVLDSASRRQISTAVETRVFFKKLSAAEIAAYVKSGEPLDKAGAYAIQGLGSLLIEKIEGDFYNVVGLPLNALARILQEFGVDLIKREET